MRSRAELKMDAKRKLNAYWQVPVCVTFVVFLLQALITGLLRDNTLGNILGTVVTTIASVFTTMLYLNIAKNDNYEKVKLSWMNVSQMKLVKCIVYALLIALGFAAIQNIASWLGVLLGILVGLFIAVLEVYLSFSLIIILDTDAPILNAVKMSIDLIEGHFWELIILGLSFIGWYILGIIPFGLGLIWVIPYSGISYANYYLELKRKKL